MFDRIDPHRHKVFGGPKAGRKNRSRYDLRHHSRHFHWPHGRPRYGAGNCLYRSAKVRLDVAWNFLCPDWIPLPNRESPCPDDIDRASVRCLLRCTLFRIPRSSLWAQHPRLCGTVDLRPVWCGSGASGATLVQGFISLAVFGFALSLPLVVAVLFEAARRSLDWLAGLSDRAPLWTGAIFIALGLWSFWAGLFTSFDSS